MGKPIKEVVTQMYHAGESEERIQQVITIYKESKAKQAKEEEDAKRIASYIKPAPAPKTVPPKVVVEEIKTEATNDEYEVGGEFSNGDRNYVKLEGGWHIKDKDGKTRLVNQEKFLKHQLKGSKPQVEKEVEKEVKKEVEQQETPTDSVPGFEQYGGLVKKKEKVEQTAPTPAPTREEVKASEESEEEKIEVPNISYEDLTNTDFFGDKEKQMVSNLSKHYANDDLKFEVVDVSGKMDDKIKVTDANGRTMIIDTDSRLWSKKPEMIMSRLSTFVDQSRKDKRVTQEDIEELQDIPLVDSLGNTKVEEVKALEEVLENEPVMSTKAQEAQARIDELNNIENAKDFDKGTSLSDGNVKKETERAEEYDAKLKEASDRMKAHLKSEGIEEGSEQWNQAMDRVKKQHDGGYPPVALNDIKLFNGDIEGQDKSRKEIYDAAIANLFKGEVRALGGLEFEEEDATDKISTWLGDGNDMKLLDGLSFEEIESLAQMTMRKDDVVDQGIGWDAGKKQAHLDKIKRKLFLQENKQHNKEFDKINKEGKDLIAKDNLIKNESESINTRTLAYNEKMAPIIEELEVIDGTKSLKEKELNDLHTKIENTPEPTTQEEVDAYNADIASYTSLRSKYDTFMDDSKKTFANYEKLQAEGDQLQLDSEDFNTRLDAHQKSSKKIQAQQAAATVNQNESLAKYSLEIANGMLNVTDQDFDVLQEYEDYRKNNKIEYSVLDPDTWGSFGSGMLNTTAKYFTGVPMMMVKGVDLAMKGVGLEGLDKEGEYDRLNFLEDMVDTYTNYDYFGTARGDDYEEGELNFINSGTKAISDGLPFMLAIMASGGKELLTSGSGLANLGKDGGGLAVGIMKQFNAGRTALANPKILSGLRSATTAFNITVRDNYIDGKQMGLNENQAFAYGNIVSGITGMVQMIMPDSKFLEAGAGSLAKKELAGRLSKFATKEGVKIASKRWAGNVLMEIAEEEVEMGLTDLAKLTFGLKHNTEFQDWSNHKQLIHGTVWLSGGVGAVGAGKDMSRVRSAINNQIKQDNIQPFLDTYDAEITSVAERLERAKGEKDISRITEYEQELERLQKGKQYVKNFKNAVNLAPENVTDDQLADLTEKQRLLEERNNTDQAFHGPINERIAAIDGKISNSLVEQKQVETNKKLRDNNIKIVKQLSKGKNTSVDEFEADPPGTKNGKTAQQKIDDFVNQKDPNNKNKNLFSKKQIAEMTDGEFYGTYITDVNGKKHLVLNKDASKEGEGVNVAAHEFLHNMLEQTFAKKDADGNSILDKNGNVVLDSEAAIGIGSGLADWVAQEKGLDFENSELVNRMQSYGDQPNAVQAQEMLTLLSDAMVTGDLAFDNGPFTRLGDVMRKGLQAAGMDVEFNTGKDVFNFVKDYNKTISSGKELSRAQRKVMEKGATVGGDISKKVSSDVVRRMALSDTKEGRDILAKEGIDPNSNDGKALLKSKPSNVKGLLDRFDGNPRAMINGTIANSREGVDVFTMKKNNGEYIDDPMVRSEFGQEIAPIVETITKRLLDPIPENLRAGVTRAQFKNDLTSIAATFTEREFKAADLGVGQTIDDFISNRLNLRANRLASDLGIESTVEEGGLGAMVSLDEAAELTTEESGPITESTPGMVLLDRIASPEQVKKITNFVKSKIKGTTIEIGKDKDGNPVFKDIKDLDYKTLPNLVKKEVAEIFGIKAVNNYIESTKTLKNDDVIRARMFIGKQASALKASLPLGITASGTATGTKQVILKNFYTKSETRAKYDPKEGGAGIFPQIKNKMSDGEFTAPFGVVKGELTNVKGQNPATLISGLMDEVGKTITNQTIRQELDKMNTAQDKDVTARINLLGDGKSDVMYSNAAIAKTGAERSVLFYEKMSDIKGENLTISDGNMENALKIHFDKEIKSGAFDVTNSKGRVTQTTEQLIEKVAKQLQPIYDRMTSGRSIQPTQVFNGQLISDIVVDQFLNDNLEDSKTYKTVSGVETDIRNPEVGKSGRKALQKLSKAFSPEFIEKYLVPSISHAGKYADGKHKFKKGTLEYEVSKNTGRSNRNTFALANNVDDARSLLNVTKPERGKNNKGIAAHEPPKPGQGLPTQENMTRIVAEQKEANQAFRDVVTELKKLYSDGEISKSDVVAILQSMNANPRGLTRMAAILDYIPSGKDAGYKGKFRLEHMTPALQMNLSALNSILSDGTESQADADFQSDMDGYKIAYLPMKYDKLVNTIYASTKPIYGQESIFRYYNPEFPGFDLEMKQLSTGETIGSGFVNDAAQQKLFKQNNTKAVEGSTLYFSKASDSNAETNRKNTIIDKAVKVSRLVNPARGITVLDFDDTLATSKSLIRYTKPDGTKGTLNAEQYAAQFQELTDLGYKWDFSEFNEVVKGKLAPLFNKAMKLQGKFGPENMFVLTARPAAAAQAINSFLSQHGLNIPLENITGLGNSTAEAKALWIAERVGDGYNDFYFADDAIQNVEAVKNMLEQFDVKSKVQQAKLTQFSKASDTFNKIIENTSGVNRFSEFSDAKAKKRGANKGAWSIFIPASAEDFKGLIYKFLGKGKQGESDLKFFQDTLMTPFARATQEIDKLKGRVANDYKALIKKFPKAKKLLNKTIPTGDFTYDTAVRVYNWVKNGYDVDGLSKTDKANLIKAVEQNPELVALASGLEQVTKGYPEPGQYWMTETIASDLNNMTEGTSRKALLEEFIQNREQIFGKWQNGKLVGPNINKIEAIHGPKFRSALEDMLWRMENGSNRNFGDNALTNKFANWVNNSVGAIMFFNARSAVLQTLSTVNFINWDFNNPLKAAKAFANQPQFWKDFSMIFNSDMLKQRRSGLKTSVSHAELAEAASNSSNPVKGVFQKMLKLGFLPTQIADSFAIASGGATFFRNRVADLVKKGMSESEAESQAFTEFQQKAEETQQSSRPDMISQQQASPLGRLVLAFQNTPMQYTRLMKKAMLDLANGRGDTKHNISKILYYGAVQNVIFSALQKAMFAFAFDDDDEEDKKKQKKKELSLVNGMIDSLLRGMGVGGAVVSTLKNMIIKFAEEDKKGWNADFDKVIIEFLNLSPPIGSKARKMKSGFSTYQFNKDVIKEMPKNTLDNPIWEVVGNIVSSTTNVPLDRIVNKLNNITEAANSDNATWQRIALMLGWNRWDLDITNDAREASKDRVEEGKKKERKAKDDEKKRVKKEAEDAEKKRKGIKEVQCSALKRKGKGDRCKNKTENKNGKCYAHQ